MQTFEQNIIDLLFVAPSLIISGVFAARKNRNAFRIWSGVVLYLTYTFTIYCFDVHFNKLFLVYCLGLGFSFYSLVFFS